MRLRPHEFIRRFLMHVLPKGFHRIRHYGLFANANRAENIATARAPLDVSPPAADPKSSQISRPIPRLCCNSIFNPPPDIATVLMNFGAELRFQTRVARGPGARRASKMRR